jgi:hypothetical protein
MHVFNKASKTDCCGTSWPLPPTPSTSAMKTQKNMEEDSTDSEAGDDIEISKWNTPLISCTAKVWEQ